MKLRLYVLLELLLESTCKIAWDKRKVNNILQYYFLYCLCFFLLSQISVLFTATFLDIIVPHWPKSETKNLHVTVFLFCFVFIPFIWILTETVAFFFFFLAKPCCLWDLIFLTRDWTCALQWGVLITGLPRIPETVAFWEFQLNAGFSIPLPFLYWL